MKYKRPEDLRTMQDNREAWLATPIPDWLREKMWGEVIIIFDFNRDRLFARLHRIQGLSEERLREIRVGNTLFQCFDDVAKDNGGRTYGKLGILMDAFGLDRKSVHPLACACTGKLSGGEIAKRLRSLRK